MTEQTRKPETFSGSSDGIQLLLDSNRGVYIPQDFAEATYLPEQAQTAIDDADLAILSDPDSELYWDVWNDVLDNWEGKDAKGNVWQLYQDGDLFAYCYDLMDCETRKNFFGPELDDSEECGHCPMCRPDEY